MLGELLRDSSLILRVPKFTTTLPEWPAAVACGGVQ